jgi:hypothetical protein
MIHIKDTIVSIDVLKEYFLCDLTACKGICCVEGDAGAPVEESEVAELQGVLPAVWDDLSPEAQALVEQQGVVYRDTDGEYLSSIVANADCVFTCYDANGICSCSIEKAYREGKTDFYKPVSCHLYPVRIVQYKGFRAVNYHRWSVCQAAILNGKKEQIRVYQFLKDPLIRKFGAEWYQMLCEAAEELNDAAKVG